MDSLLAQRTAALERQVKFLRFSLLVLFLGVILFNVLSASTKATSGEHLRVRSLALVDEHGVARMLLAAPLPNPVSGGKESPRRSKSYGIQLNDAKGNEFGGLTIADDGALVECFDWAQGEATCMFAMPSGDAGFEVNERGGKTRAQLMLSSNHDVALTLNDGKETPRIGFRVAADGKTSIESPATVK
jgi:hypothetical protein